MIISNEKTVLVSPTNDSLYQLEIKTESGQIAYAEILVQVLKVLNTSFNYRTGNLESSNGDVLLLKEQALSDSWIATGTSLVTHENFIGSKNLKTLTSNGGIKFSTDVFIPKNCSSVIAGISFDGIKFFELSSYYIKIDNKIIDLNISIEENQNLKIEISAIYNAEKELWECFCYVFDKKANQKIYENTEEFKFGGANTELGLYFADNALATFYYGINEKPTAIIKGNHISVLKGSSIVLDGSDSYDNDLNLNQNKIYFIKPDSWDSLSVFVYDNNVFNGFIELEKESDYYVFDVSRFLSCDTLDFLLVDTLTGEWEDSKHQSMDLFVELPSNIGSIFELDEQGKLKDLGKFTKSELKYTWNTGETTDKITVFPNKTTEYSLKVEDESGAFDETTITRTNCWVEKLDEHTYRLGAVLEDVKDKYFFEWYDDFDNYGNNWCIEVSPPSDNTYFCKIIDKETNESDVISLFVESKKRILHAKNPETGEIQEIYVYPNTNNLNGKFIECKVDGYIGYIAYDLPSHKNASILNCSVNGEVFKILKRI